MCGQLSKVYDPEITKYLSVLSQELGAVYKGRPANGEGGGFEISDIPGRGEGGWFVKVRTSVNF